MTSLLGCSVEGRWNEAPMELGVDTCTFYCQPAVVFSVYVGQKNKKTRMGHHPVSFWPARLPPLQLSGPSRLGVTKEFIKLLHPLIPWATFDDGVHQVRAVREARE